MKAIFLDIDGVVCLHSAKTPNDEEIFDADSCRRLKEIIDATDCKLVLTSSWRLYSESIRSMFFQFKKYGIYKEHFLGRTPLCGERGNEIMAYLKSHPQIVNYIALDDQLFYRSKFPKDRLIRTHVETGITEEVKQLCVAKLSIANSNVLKV